MILKSITQKGSYAKEADYEIEYLLRKNNGKGKKEIRKVIEKFDGRNIKELPNLLSKLRQEIALSIDKKESRVRELEHVEKNDSKIVKKNEIIKIISIIISILVAAFTFLTVSKLSIIYPLHALQFVLLSTVAAFATGIGSGFLFRKAFKNAEIEILEKSISELENEFDLVTRLLEHFKLSERIDNNLRNRNYKDAEKLKESEKERLELSKEQKEDIFEKRNDAKPSIARKMSLISGKKPNNYREFVFYHKYHDKRLNEYAKEITDGVEKVRPYETVIKNGKIRVNFNTIAKVFKKRKGTLVANQVDSKFLLKQVKDDFICTNGLGNPWSDNCYEDMIKRGEIFDVDAAKKAFAATIDSSLKGEPDEKRREMLIKYRDAFITYMENYSELKRYEKEPIKVKLRIMRELRSAKYLLMGIKKTYARYNNIVGTDHYTKVFIPK